MSDTGRVIKGALLVAGTTIGGGILGLPVLTSQAGFIPSVCMYLICWLFMACTGLLFLEVSQWMEKDANILSMAKNILGKPGKYFAWVLYLFLFYCLTVAYMVGCGNIIVEVLQNRIPDEWGPIVFTLIFCSLIFIPTALASHLNVWMIIGLAISYLGFVFLGFQYFRIELLQIRDWSYSFKVLPIAFISFAYQGIIPTLANFLDHDAKKIRKAIIVGSFIPLFAYIIWEGLILGIVPPSQPHNLEEALRLGQNAVYSLKFFIKEESVYWLGQAFAFFALLTSFLGVSLGLRDFLADGLHIRKNIPGKIILTFLVLTPPLLIAVTYPHVFLIALEYAGGFGSALLLGLLPIVMTWRGRYSLHFPLQPQIPGGRITLFLLGLFVTFELISEGKQLLNRLL